MLPTAPLHLLAAVLATLPATAGRSTNASVGIVLLHGKLSAPAHLDRLAEVLSNAGFLVATPEMPWSSSRRYDAPLDRAFMEIDASLEGLRQRGAKTFVMAGHSMGANVALAYTVAHLDISALLMIAPGQTVETTAFRRALGDSVARARAQVSAGHADEVTSLDDLHLGEAKAATTTARIYMSYFDPAGPTNMPRTIERLRTPLLWVVGTADRSLVEKGRAYAFARAPGTALDRYVEVDADHMGTPDASVEAVTVWLSSIFPQRPSPQDSAR